MDGERHAPPKPGSPAAPFASPEERLAGHLKDAATYLIGLVVPLALLLALDLGVGALLTIPAVITLAFVDQIVGTGLVGQSVGKRLQRIKVVDRDTGGPIGIRRAALRLAWESAAILSISILTETITARTTTARRGTAVIRVRRPL